IYTNNTLIKTTYSMENSVEFTSYNSKKIIGYINISNSDIFTKTIELNDHFICNLDASKYGGFKVNLEIPSEYIQNTRNRNYYSSPLYQINLKYKQSVSIPITLTYNSYQDIFSKDYYLFEKNTNLRYKVSDCFILSNEGSLGKININSNIKKPVYEPRIQTTTQTQKTDHNQNTEYNQNLEEFKNALNNSQTPIKVSTVVQTYNFSSIHDLSSDNHNNILIGIDSINNISYDAQNDKMDYYTLYIAKKIHNKTTTEYFTTEETENLKKITIDLKAEYTIYFDKKNDLYVLVNGKYLYKKENNEFNLIYTSPIYQNINLDTIFDLDFDSDNNMYFATQYRLLKFEEGNIKVLSDTFKEDNNSNRLLVIDRNDNIFFSTNNQIFKYSNGTVSLIAGSKYSTSPYISSGLAINANIQSMIDMEIDKDDNIYFISNAGRMYKIENETYISSAGDFFGSYYELEITSGGEFFASSRAPVLVSQLFPNN
ncbi:MAG: hypothetical protein KC550_07415, partial [Nanoarchaeota archaeon]|nr:hypothetical protein [Nanoarchaeota archaeon]